MARTMLKRLGAAAAVAFAALSASPAVAYVGPSYLHLPGISGTWKGEAYKGWFRIDASYWDGKLTRLGGARRASVVFAKPRIPVDGAGRLVLGLDKDNPGLAKLMQQCRDGAKLPELRYAEFAQFTRNPMIGPRPSAVPEYFEYTLKGPRFVDCPVVAGAPQQAVVIAFDAVEVTNYKGEGEPVVWHKPQPAQLLPASMASAGKSRSFVLTWFAAAHDVSDDQCPVMNKKPTEDDYYALMHKEDADKERIENAKNGGVNYENGQMGLRGPNKLDVTRLPGLIVDPGNAAPRTKLARGFNLDGDEGTGKPRKGVRAHVNYVDPDGRTGIDNQLYTSQGCIASFMGRKGFVLQFSNNQMRDGMLSMIVEIAGIDDERNDDAVEVMFAYSHDPMAKSGSGAQILPDYTFRLTDDPEFTHYFTRVEGRIVDGVIEVAPVDRLLLNLGQFGTPNELELAQARVRLEITPEGNLKGVLGGYMDWRPIISRYITSTVENIHGFTVPGLYNALRRNADGLYDPQTGEWNGISSAYDIEGVPVFVQPALSRTSVAANSVAPVGGVIP